MEKNIVDKTNGIMSANAEEFRSDSRMIKALTKLYSVISEIQRFLCSWLALAFRFGGRVSLGGGRELVRLISKKAAGRTGKLGTGKNLIGAYRQEELVSPEQGRNLLGLTGGKNW